MASPCILPYIMVPESWMMNFESCRLDIACCSNKTQQQLKNRGGWLRLLQPSVAAAESDVGMLSSYALAGPMYRSATLSVRHLLRSS